MSKKESNAAPDIARPVPPPAPPVRALSCVTHHHACDCREAEWAQKMATQQARNEALVAAATDVVWHISEFTDWKMGTEAVQRDIKALAALLQE